MSWDAYYREICKAKEEHDRAMKPAIEALDRLKKCAWECYVEKIRQAEILLNEDCSKKDQPYAPCSMPYSPRLRSVAAGANQKEDQS